MHSLPSVLYTSTSYSLLARSCEIALCLLERLSDVMGNGYCLYQFHCIQNCITAELCMHRLKGRKEVPVITGNKFMFCCKSHNSRYYPSLWLLFKTQDDSENRFCPRLQVQPTELGARDRAVLCLRKQKLLGSAE
jgi:hypothetical protein